MYILCYMYVLCVIKHDQTFQFVKKVIFGLRPSHILAYKTVKNSLSWSYPDDGQSTWLISAQIIDKMLNCFSLFCLLSFPSISAAANLCVYSILTSEFDLHLSGRSYLESGRRSYDEISHTLWCSSIIRSHTFVFTTVVTLKIEIFTERWSC